ncbi:hypothetical protein [Sphingosinithalassobacter sp. LHW66-3]|uniref:hypothetical protein n=1 Tax=Sphingosinithalassobacter sp. LHW66-3 TaxID=3424718 RepID=UPI003D6A1FFF
MRIEARFAALAALMLLGGCDPIGGDRDETETAAPDFASREAAAAFAATGSPFDYRYAFRLPGDRVKPVLESNADACDRLGEQRCRVLAVRYRVKDASRVTAVLTVKIDPAIARAFGDAVTEAVASADGQLVDTEIAGGELTARRTASLTDRLQQALEEAEQRPGPEAAARADRIRAALATISEVQDGRAESYATAPVLITYESSNALTPLGSTPDASFRNAGETLEKSVAGVVQLLAGVGPWLVLMIVIVFLLRLVIHSTSRPRTEGEDPVPNAVPVQDRDSGDDRNLIQRWFARDEDDDER